VFKAAITLAAALLVSASIPAAAAEHGEPAKAPPVEKPAVEKPAVVKPAIVKPAAEKPAAEKPAAEKPAEKVAEKPAEGSDRLAEKLAKDAASAQKVKKQVKKVNGDSVTSVDEPESQPPPLKVSALKNEIRRHAEGGERGPKTERESLAMMAAELNEAREALRQDTARMEALMASADPAASQGEGGKKAPAPLDLVAKALRGMKPEQAGPIVAHMDRKLAADVLRRMPPADAGKVMGVLKPELAAELAAEIALRGPHAERKR